MDTPASRTPPLYRLFPASCFLCHVMPCFATPLTSRTTLLLLLLLLLILFLLLTPVLPFHYCEIGPGRARCDAMRCDALTVTIAIPGPHSASYAHCQVSTACGCFTRPIGQSFCFYTIGCRPRRSPMQPTLHYYHCCLFCRIPRTR